MHSRKGAHHLNNEHTVFGEVIEGLELPEKISQSIFNRSGDVEKIFVHIENSILNIMVCIEHKNNTVDKKIWYKSNNEINLNINEHLKILSKLEI